MTPHRALPWAALAATILIWAGYLVAVRAGVKSDLTPLDIGLLRSLPAALCLLPITLRRGLMPGGAGVLDILLIGGLGGTCFSLLLGGGMQFAPVADSGIFAPSMLPLFVAILAVIFLGTRYRREQIAGFVLIFIGALALGGYDAISTAGSGAWRGHILFLIASFCWAIYTIRYRASGLAAIDAAIILVTWASLAFVLAVAVFGTNIPQTPWPILAIQLAWGLLAGLLANFFFLFAIRNLGHEIPAAGTALVPILAAVGGVVFLAEPIGAKKWAEIAIVSFGVLLAAGLFSRKRSAQH